MTSHDELFQARIIALEVTMKLLNEHGHLRIGKGSEDALRVFREEFDIRLVELGVSEATRDTVLETAESMFMYIARLL